MDEYDKMFQENKVKETDLIEELKSHHTADEQFHMTTSYILELAKWASELFINSQPDQKNRLMRFVFANAKVEAYHLYYKLKKPFEGIVENNKK